MIGALFNALLYILVLIKPNKMNQIANYFSEDLRLNARGHIHRSNSYTYYIDSTLCMRLSYN